MVPTFNLKEYKPTHTGRYLKEIAENRVTSDPPSRLKKEAVMADLQERAEDNHMINDQGSFCSTIRERSVTTLSSVQKMADSETYSNLKSHDFFLNKLKAQTIVKNLQLVYSPTNLRQISNYHMRDV